MTDPDVGDTHTFTVSDPRFQVVGNVLELASGVSLSHETEPTVPLAITATDQGGLSVTDNFTITVLHVNHAPTNVTLDNTTVLEDAPGAVIGNLTVTDPDVGDTHTFTVSDPRFQVVGSVLELASGVSLSHETEPTVPLAITATDQGALSVTDNFTITVLHVNHPPSDLTLSNNTVPEQDAGAVVGTLTGTDPDVGDTLTYSVVNDARFTVVNNVLELNLGMSVLYANAATLVLDVRVTDQGGLSLTRSFVIDVLPIIGQVDVTSMLTITYYGTQYNRSTHNTSFYGTVTNNTSTPIQGPIWLSWLNLSPSTVSVLQPTGTLPSGAPYFDLTALAGGDGILNPGETTTARSFSLYNPNNVRYTFESQVLGVLPPAPAPPQTHIFLDFAGGTLPAPAAVEQVPAATGVTHPAYVAFGGVDRETQIEQIVTEVRAEFAAYPVQVLRDDDWQDDPLFHTGDTVIYVGGDGSWLVGTNPVFNTGSVSLTAGGAPVDPGNQYTDIGFVFAAAVGQAESFLGETADQYAQQIANAISHEAGHTFGLWDVTALNGTTDLMGSAGFGTQINGPGVFSTAVLPREGGGAYSSDAYLRSVFGLSSAPLPSESSGSWDPMTLEFVVADDGGTLPVDTPPTVAPQTVTPQTAIPQAFIPQVFTLPAVSNGNSVAASAPAPLGPPPAPMPALWEGTYTPAALAGVPLPNGSESAAALPWESGPAVTLQPVPSRLRFVPAVGRAADGSPSVLGPSELIPTPQEAPASAARTAIDLHGQALANWLTEEDATVADLMAGALLAAGLATLARDERDERRVIGLGG